jgi:hypothetical protein
VVVPSMYLFSWWKNIQVSRPPVLAGRCHRSKE